jgi:hypothetical protein
LKLSVSEETSFHLATITRKKQFFQQPTNPMDNMNTNWNWNELAGGWEIDSEGAPCEIAIDAQGRPHILFTNASLAPHYYRYVRHDGTRWRYHVVDRYIMQWGADVSIALDQSGRAHLAYIKVTDAQNGTLYYTAHDGEWKQGWVPFSDVIRPLFCSVAVDSRNLPHVVYYDGLPQRRLCVASNNGGAWKTHVIQDTGYSVGLWCSAAMDAGDRLHIAFHDNSNFRLMYAVGSGTNFRVEVVDEVRGQAVGYHCRLALDGQGRPHIVGTANAIEHEPAEVRYAWHDGTQWRVETVIAKASRASAVAIAVDSQGRPHVLWQYLDSYEVFLATKEGDHWTHESMLPGFGFENCVALRFDVNDRLHIAIGHRLDLWKIVLLHGTRGTTVADVQPPSKFVSQRSPVQLRDVSTGVEESGAVIRIAPETFPLVGDPP